MLYEGNKCKVCAKEIPVSAQARFIETTTGGSWTVHADCWNAIANQYPDIKLYQAQASELRQQQERHRQHHKQK